MGKTGFRKNLSFSNDSLKGIIWATVWAYRDQETGLFAPLFKEGTMDIRVVRTQQQIDLMIQDFTEPESPYRLRLRTIEKGKDVVYDADIVISEGDHRYRETSVSFENVMKCATIQRLERLLIEAGYLDKVRIEKGSEGPIEMTRLVDEAL